MNRALVVFCGVAIISVCGQPIDSQNNVSINWCKLNKIKKIYICVHCFQEKSMKPSKRTHLSLKI